MRSEKTINLDFELWPKQLTAFHSFAQERLYGGAAGGGKSHLERVETIVIAFEIPGIQIYLFRRSFKDLKTSYIEGPTGYNALLGELIHEGEVESVSKEVRFPNGSKIFLCHCQHEKDVVTFGSFEFHMLLLAEAGEFTPFQIRFLRSRVRMPEQFKETLPQKYLIPKQYWRSAEKPEYSFPRASYTCNPIGPGKAYLKKAFVDGHAPESVWRAPEDDGGMLRQFIPAKLADNPSLDPTQYASQLKGIGNKAYIDALLDGDWSATIGAFFPQIDREKHLIMAFKIPDHWARIMVMDWGACGEGDPFSIGWYAISDGTIPVYSAYSGEPMSCRRGAFICYRRWNGAGLPKVDAAIIADGIKDREKSNENILRRIAGGDILESRGHGQSIFTIFSSKGITFTKADMRRQNGWAQVDYRLNGEGGNPLSFWFEECKEDLDTMGDLQHDMTDPSDIAPGNDHDADRHRYACMVYPIVKEAPKEEDINYQSALRQPTPNVILKHLNKKDKPAYASR